MSLPPDVARAFLETQGYEYIGPADSADDKPPPGENWTVVGMRNETTDTTEYFRVKARQPGN